VIDILKGHGKPTALISTQRVGGFPLSVPSPPLLMTRQRNIAESGTLREVHTLIYPEADFLEYEYFS
jgi:hypothetical protein